MAQPAGSRRGGASGAADSGGDSRRSALRALQERAQASNLARSGRVACTLNALSGGPLEEAARLEAADLAHSIIGSAGTFGFPHSSELATRLEGFFKAGRFDQRRVDQAREWLNDLQVDLGGEPALDADGENDAW